MSAASAPTRRRVRVALPRARIDAWRLAPVLAAGVGAAAYLILQPHNVDLSAHIYRADLFGREGFTIWNGGWYAGHHTPAYSVLFPPLAWWLGLSVAGALSVLAIAALFDALARGHWGERARWGPIWLGLGSATLLFTGRLPFAMGVAVGLGALLALQRRRTRLAWPLAVACSLSSPIAGLFLVLAVVSCALAVPDRRRAAAGVAVCALVPPVLLSLAFPEGGWEPFVLSAFLPVPLTSAAAVLILPRRESTLRIGAVLYGLAGTAAYFLHTPMGGNAMRLGALFAGPVLLSAVRPRRHLALFAVLLVALGYWQWTSATQDFVKSQEDPSVKVRYYKPLVRFLDRHAGGPPGRVEVVFTRGHWEAAEIANHYPLARGWQRQLDLGRNGFFYGGGGLNRVTYGVWLAEHAVRYVAVGAGKPDYSSYTERGLIESGPPYLRMVWHSKNWRVYAVTLPHAMAVPDPGADMTVTSMGNDELTLAVRKPGAAVVRVSWTPYWRAFGGCVQRAGDWTRVTARKPGTLRMAIDFSPERIFEHGRRCG